MKIKTNYIFFSALTCILVCIGEFVFMFVCGAFYPGYNQLKDTMSSLGASVSPVSGVISAWWVIMGVLLVFFGTGLRNAFSEKRGYAGLASWLIILYGLGEGIGSGVFKADHVAGRITTSGIIHDILGGIGVTAALLFPLIMLKIVAKNERPVFYRMSQVVFVCGIITILLFLFRFSSDENDFFSVYKGLWQRLFMLDIYIYLTTIAVIMIKMQKKFIGK